MIIPSILENLVFELDDLVPPDYCKFIIDRAEQSGFEPATIITEQGVTIAADIRNNERVIFDDPDMAQALWEKVRFRFDTPFKNAMAIGLNERFRIYKYVPGQFFDWHQDGAFKRSESVESKFTFMIYLNDTFDGGNTTFADVFSPFSFKDFEVFPKTGKALFFHHPLSHRGDPVLDGVKYVLRSDVMFNQAL